MTAERALLVAAWVVIAAAWVLLYLGFRDRRRAARAPVVPPAPRKTSTLTVLIDADAGPLRDALAKVRAGAEATRIALDEAYPPGSPVRRFIELDGPDGRLNDPWVLGRRLCAVLGLDPTTVRGLDLNYSAGKWPQVRVLRTPRWEDGALVAEVLEEFELEPRQSGESGVDG